MVADAKLGQCVCSRYKGKVNPVLGIHTATRQGSFAYNKQYKSRINCKTCTARSCFYWCEEGVCVMAQSGG